MVQRETENGIGARLSKVEFYYYLFFLIILFLLRYTEIPASRSGFRHTEKISVGNFFYYVTWTNKKNKVIHSQKTIYKLGGHRRGENREKFCTFKLYLRKLIIFGKNFTFTFSLDKIYHVCIF